MSERPTESESIMFNTDPIDRVAEVTCGEEREDGTECPFEADEFDVQDAQGIRFWVCPACGYGHEDEAPEDD